MDCSPHAYPDPRPWLAALDALLPERERAAARQHVARVLLAASPWREDPRVAGLLTRPPMYMAGARRDWRAAARASGEDPDLTAAADLFLTVRPVDPCALLARRGDAQAAPLAWARALDATLGPLRDQVPYLQLRAAVLAAALLERDVDAARRSAVALLEAAARRFGQSREVETGRACAGAAEALRLGTPSPFDERMPRIVRHRND